MIKKYNEFLNEKLSDKLSGFDEEGLKKQFLNGELDLQQYLNICNKNNFELPPYDYVKQKFIDKKINPFVFTFISKHYYDIEIDSDFIGELLKNNQITLNEYIGLTNEYKLKNNNDLIINYVKHNKDINYDDLSLVAINTDNVTLLKLTSPHIKQINRCIMYNSINCFKYLIDKNIFNKNEVLKKTCTSDKKIEFTKYLIENGADIHHEQEYALKQAIDFEQIETVKYLLEHGAIVDVRMMHKMIDNTNILKILQHYYNMQ